MALQFKRVVGQSNAAGTAVYTVPAGKVNVIIGFRLANNTSAMLEATLKIADTNIAGAQTPIAPNGAYAFMEAEKLIAEPGDTIVVQTPNDGDGDFYVSMYEEDA